MAYAKKTIEIDVEAIKKVRKIFDLDTDKEAVNQALRLIAEEDDIIKIHEKLAGKLSLEDIFS